MSTAAAHTNSSQGVSLKPEQQDKPSIKLFTTQWLKQSKTCLCSKQPSTARSPKRIKPLEAKSQLSQTPSCTLKPDSQLKKTTLSISNNILLIAKAKPQCHNKTTQKHSSIPPIGMCGSNLSKTSKWRKQVFTKAKKRIPSCKSVWKRCSYQKIIEASKSSKLKIWCLNSNNKWHPNFRRTLT